MSMDSATSESFQSSNGGGDFDDFDSRAPPDSISSFLTPSPPQSSRSLFNPFPSHHPPSFLSDLDVSSWNPPPPPQPPLASATNSTPTAASSSAAGPRGSKKRARASRRAPTTVLTTDTSNFRAMVQEFTGIPAPPFGTSSSFSRPRLDLLHSAAAAPAFLLRPFSQKVHAAAPSSDIIGIPSNTSPSSVSIQNQNFFFNGQDPVLSLQSMLQEQQRAMALCQWPASGYAGGELGSVIAGASVDTESKRIGNCKSDHTGSSLAEKQQPEGFSAASAAANARGEGGVDGWHISSD